MAALQKHGARAHLQQCLRGGRHVLGVLDPAAQQQRGFVQVGRDQRGARKQLGHQRLHRGRLDQRGAGGRHHHRIEHHVRQRVAVDGLRHGLRDLGRVQHADLDRVHADVAGHGVDLRGQKIRRHGVDAGHAQRVLRRQRGERAHAVGAQRGKSFQISLNARATARIRAGDGQHAQVFLGMVRQFHGRMGLWRLSVQRGQL